MNPIQQHSTWTIYDSSKLTTYMSCPRKYFYEYMLGWRRQVQSNHLVFGEAWHRAMRVLLAFRTLKLNPDLTPGYPAEAIPPAFDAFMEYYRVYFGEETDSNLHPKSPANALKGLEKYVEKYAADSFETIYTEVAGSVPITGDKRVCFRLDGVIRSDCIYSVLEHKSTGRLGDYWGVQWDLATQMSTYFHVLKCLYKENELDCINVNGTAFKVRDVAFMRHIVKPPNHVMQAWLSNCERQINQIKLNTEILLHSDDSESFLDAFPTHTIACSNYGTCPWHDFCRSWPNPLRCCAEPPVGHELHWWNPSDTGTEPDKKVEL